MVCSWSISAPLAEPPIEKCCNLPISTHAGLPDEANDSSLPVKITIRQCDVDVCTIVAVCGSESE